MTAGTCRLPHRTPSGCVLDVMLVVTPDSCCWSISTSRHGREIELQHEAYRNKEDALSALGAYLAEFDRRESVILAAVKAVCRPDAITRTAPPPIAPLANAVRAATRAAGFEVI